MVSEFCGGGQDCAAAESAMDVTGFKLRGAEIIIDITGCRGVARKGLNRPGDTDSGPSGAGLEEGRRDRTQQKEKG